MARPRLNNPDGLPRYLHHKHGAFYFVRGGTWTRIATNISDALVELARRISPNAKDDGTAGMAMPALLATALPDLQRNIAPSTQKKYAFASKQLSELFARATVGEVTGKKIRELRRSLTGQPSKFNALFSVLRMSLEWAVENEMIKDNPCVGIEQLPAAQRVRYLTDDEYNAIWANACGLVRAVMEICYRTGQRIADVLKITHDDITADGILFEQAKGRNAGKAGTGNKVLTRFTPELRAAVEAAKALDADNVVALKGPRYLLAARGGKAWQYQSILTRWLKACAAAGVENAHIHDIRAKSATDVDRVHGEDGLAKAQALLGHATSGMTLRYIRQRRTKVATGPTAAA